MKRCLMLVIIAGAALAAASAASAHVTLNPSTAEADSFARFAIRVPTERDVPTVKLSIQLPPGLEEAGFQPKPGWTRTQKGRIVTWSGGKIGVGEFDEFGMSVHLPNTAGTTLTFPATQTYANGEVVHWIGAADADEPAPHVTLTAAEPEGSMTGAKTTAASASASSDDSNDSNDNLAIGLAIAGIVLALVALAVPFFWRRPQAKAVT